MRFILILDKKKAGRVVQKEIIDHNAYPSLEELGKAVAEKVIAYEKQFPFPEFEIVTGNADSLEDFLKGFPEYG